MKKTSILITGATGFVGISLCQLLKQKNVELSAVVRDPNFLDNEINLFYAELENTQVDWLSILKGVDVVIHLAARAHIIDETELNPYEAYKSLNVDVTKRLVGAAVKAGVKRFIYMSTTKVCGEYTKDHAFNEEAELSPLDDYGKTKAAAEALVIEVCNKNDMEYVIIRPPLVYGPNVKANFGKLISLSRSFVPLPFGRVNNQRSLIYVENLVNFVWECVEHDEASNQIFFVSDGEDISTANLIRMLGSLQGKRPVLLPIPAFILKFFLELVKPSSYYKLCGNLQVDSKKARKLLQWTPPFTLEEGMKKTVRKA